MNLTRPLLAMLVAGLLHGLVCHAEVVVYVNRNDNTSASPAFRFGKVPGPSRSDAATTATFTIIEGAADHNGASVNVLHDGLLPVSEDQPAENFFFRAGGNGGRLLVDLGRAIGVKQVNTYSWHPDTRGPQVYTLFASRGTSSRFDAMPKRDTDPATCGWEPVSAVDTRPDEGEPGGQYGVSIWDSYGVLGRYRYLLFDIAPTESDDPFGNTFFSEIDVVDPDGDVLAAVPAQEETLEVRRELVEAAEGKYQISIDTTGTPDLTQWVHEELAPVVRTWYPKLVAMLPSEGYEAPTRVTIVFDPGMQGVAATGGTHVRCAAAWFRQQLEGEAKGAVVHELVHVVQQYGRGRKDNPDATQTPGWLVEGICDYIRWFLYEPESHGAEISPGNLAHARHDGGYRITGNFLNWVTETHDKAIVRKLNEAAREGCYSADLWKAYTGFTVDELNVQWRAQSAKGLSNGETASPEGASDPR